MTADSLKRIQYYTNFTHQLSRTTLVPYLCLFPIVSTALIAEFCNKWRLCTLCRGQSIFHFLKKKLSRTRFDKLKWITNDSRILDNVQVTKQKYSWCQRSMYASWFLAASGLESRIIGDIIYFAHMSLHSLSTWCMDTAYSMYLTTQGDIHIFDQVISDNNTRSIQFE